MTVETFVVDPPVEKWREDIEKKLDAYLNKSVKLSGSTITLEKGEYGVRSDLEGRLEKNHDGNYKILVGKLENGEKMYYHFNPELVELEENPTETIGIKSLSVTVK